MLIINEFENLLIIKRRKQSAFFLNLKQIILIICIYIHTNLYTVYINIYYTLVYYIIIIDRYFIIPYILLVVITKTIQG